MVDKTLFYVIKTRYLQKILIDLLLLINIYNLLLPLITLKN